MRWTESQCSWKVERWVRTSLCLTQISSSAGVISLFARCTKGKDLLKWKHQRNPFVHLQWTYLGRLLKWMFALGALVGCGKLHVFIACSFSIAPLFCLYLNPTHPWLKEGMRCLLLTGIGLFLLQTVWKTYVLLLNHSLQAPSGPLKKYSSSLCQDSAAKEKAAHLFPTS